MRFSSSLALQLRHHLVLVILPPLAIVGLLELFVALRLAPQSLDTLWWIGLPLIVTMLVLMPAAVRRVWQTSPLTLNPLRQRLDDLCRDRRCALRDILIWHTGGTMANAAVVGLSPWLRYMLLTDVLVKHFSDDELVAVARHELAHLRRWHLPLRLAVLLLPVAWWMTIKNVWPQAEPAVENTFAANFAVPLALLAYVVVAVGACSRFFEYDADLDACLDAHGCIDPLAAHHLSNTLTALGHGSRESWLTRWLHPPVSDRAERLLRAVQEPARAKLHRHRFIGIIAGLAALYSSALATAILL